MFTSGKEKSTETNRHEKGIKEDSGQFLIENKTTNYKEQK